MNKLKKIVKNKKFVFTVCLVVTILGLLFIVSGTSYALLSGSSTSGNEQIIKAGDVTIALTEHYDEIGNKISVLPDSEGLLQEEVYNFNIKNLGDATARYDIKLVNEVPSSYSGPTIDDKYVKVGLEINGEEHGPFTLEEAGNILDSGIIYKNELIEYNLRIWLSEDYEEEILEIDGAKAYFKIEVEAKQSMALGLDESGANKPVLDTNMIAVYYDETAEVWKKADSTNGNPTYKWYDYDNKMWANSVTVTETNRTTYVDASLGTEIPMDDILTMQVWIPRYKYKVWNYNADGTVTSEPQEIEIVFEEGTNSTGDITCTDTISGTDGAKSESCKINSAECTDSTCNNKYYTHPAFTFGEEELTGFWIGKFELTGTISNITTKPDLSSLRNKNVSSFETNIMKMNDSGNQYGFNTSTDIHMIKNMEWGAVAYLSHSKYGVNREVYINNSSSYYTGRSGGNVGGETPINGTYTDQTSTTQYNSYGFYTYDGYLLEYGTNTKSSTKDISKVASTTGNIYGVYDISGGARDYVMGNIVSSDGTTMRAGSSGFTTYPDTKYYDKYSFGTDNQRIRSKLGDGIKEVLNTSSYGWYSDNSYLASSNYPWFYRGGNYSNDSRAGAFSSSNGSGFANAFCSSRLVITP